MISILNAFIAGCTAVPTTELALSGDYRGAAFAGFISLGSIVCAIGTH